MDHSRQSQRSNPDTLERDLALLRTRLQRWDGGHQDIIDDLRRLRLVDPLAEETIRHFAEKYFPGSEDIRRKAKAVRMMTAAFLVLSDTKQTLDTINTATPRAATQNKKIG